MTKPDKFYLIAVNPDGEESAYARFTENDGTWPISDLIELLTAWRETNPKRIVKISDRFEK